MNAPDLLNDGDPKKDWYFEVDSEHTPNLVEHLRSAGISFSVDVKAGSFKTTVAGRVERAGTQDWYRVSSNTKKEDLAKILHEFFRKR